MYKHCGLDSTLDFSTRLGRRILLLFLLLSISAFCVLHHLYNSIRFGSRDRYHDAALDLQYLFGFSMPRGAPALPTATGPPVTARPSPSAPHGSPTWPRRQKGRRRQTRRAGNVGKCPLGDGVLGPKGGIPGKREISIIFGGTSLVGFFSCPRF